MHSLVAKDGEDCFIDRLHRAILQGAGRVQVVHLSNDETIHSPEDGIDVRKPDPAQAKAYKSSSTACMLAWHKCLMLVQSMKAANKADNMHACCNSINNMACFTIGRCPPCGAMWPEVGMKVASCRNLL